MAIITDDLGGTDASDGDRLDAADLTNTYDAVTLHRKQFSDATERTTASTSFVDSGTEFTLSVPVNSIVTGFFVNSELKNAGGGTFASMTLKINGTNLGVKYLERAILLEGSTGTVTLKDSELSLFATLGASTGFSEHAASGFTPLKILDASTTLTVRIKASGSITTLKNVTVDVLYIKAFKED